MSITEQSDAAILATFHSMEEGVEYVSMEEGVEYVLNDHWFAEMNRVRKEYNWSTMQLKKEYTLSRRGEKLFLNGCERFDFKNKVNLTLAFASTFTLTLTLAFQHNGIEKLNKDTCDGKVVEIDGKKYKLTSV
jgi:hypothetical protein